MKYFAPPVHDHEDSASAQERETTVDLASGDKDHVEERVVRSMDAEAAFSAAKEKRRSMLMRLKNWSKESGAQSTSDASVGFSASASSSSASGSAVESYANTPLDTEALAPAVVRDSVSAQAYA